MAIPAPITFATHLLVTESPHEAIIAAELIAQANRGRLAVEEGWDRVFDFGSALGYRLWGGIIGPHPERRLPYRMRLSVGDQEGRTRLDIAFESTQGPYLIRPGLADRMFLQQYESQVGALAVGLGTAT